MAGELLSKDLILKIYNVAAAGYVTVARSTSYTMEVDKETVDITSFDGAGWKEFLVDLKGFTMSADGIVIRTAESGKRTYEQLLTDMIGSDATMIVQLVNPAMYTDATDGATYSHEIGNCHITSLPLTGAVGDKQTYSLTLQGTGTLTHVVAKYDTEAEAFAAEAIWAELQVIFVEDNVDGSDDGYYVRTADGSPGNFGEAWTDYTP
jgi:TP901-1 family phage major tail protein